MTDAAIAAASASVYAAIASGSSSAPAPTYINVVAASAKDSITASAFTASAASGKINDLYYRISALKKNCDTDPTAKISPTTEKVRAIAEMADLMREISGRLRDLQKMADNVLNGPMESSIDRGVGRV